MRRSLLRLLELGMLAVIPGAGGQVPPRPDQQYQAGQAVPVSPGTSNITRARLVIVSGPSGTINGIFIYQPGTTPGAGNPPVLSGTAASADPFANAVNPGWTATGAGGSYLQLDAAALDIVAATGQFSPGSVSHDGAAGGVLILSGNAISGDSPASIDLQSAHNSFNATGNPLIILTASKALIPPVLAANAGSTVEIQDSLIVDTNLTVSGTTITAGAVTAVDLHLATVDLHNGNLNLNMADPPNTAAVIAGTATQAQYNACLGGMLNSMKNRQLFA